VLRTTLSLGRGIRPKLFSKPCDIVCVTMSQLRIVSVVFLLGALACAGFRSNAQTGGDKVTRMEFGKCPMAAALIDSR
jgi:hypothetical protein